MAKRKQAEGNAALELAAEVSKQTLLDESERRRKRLVEIEQSLARLEDKYTGFLIKVLNEISYAKRQLTTAKNLMIARPVTGQVADCVQRAFDALERCGELAELEGFEKGGAA